MGNISDSQLKKADISKRIDEYVNRIVWNIRTEQIAIPRLSQLYILREEHGTLLSSSTIKFGAEAMRLANIAFNTSKLFPSVMSTCDDISQYLREELQQKHSRCHFHIIIAENDGFDFSIGDYIHFADIKQDQYRLLIFSTKLKETTKMDTNDANDQMKLRWKSVIIK